MSVEITSLSNQTEGKTERAAKNLKIKTTPQLKPEETFSRKGSTSVASFALKQDQNSGRIAGNVTLENTYKTAPDNKFPIGNIKRILKDVLTENLNEVEYEEAACRLLSKVLSDELKKRVKELDIPRYKIVAVVHIGSMGSGESILIGSRCLWNENFDTYSCYKFKNNSLFAVATVYGVYFE